LVVFLGIVTILSLFWLPTGVVLAIFFGFIVLILGAGRGGSIGPLQFAQLRFDLVHEVNIIVVLHDFDLGIVVSMTQRCRPQVDLRHILWLHPGHVQRQRKREE